MRDFATKLEDAKRARAGETIAPAFQKDAYHCSRCAVFAPHKWVNLVEMYRSGGSPFDTPIWRATCDNCQLQSYWIDTKDTAVLLWPDRAAAGPLPHPAMPDDVRGDFDEARGIAQASPRGAAALLRLALQKLMPHLGQKGTDLNDDIGALVRSGLDPRVQKALDSLRVIGNNAVHPGELSLDDDAETAQGLFTMLNFIVEQLIELPRRLDAMYDQLPEGARAQIEQRDA